MKWIAGAAVVVLALAGCGETKTVTVTERVEATDPPPATESDEPTGKTQTDDQRLALTVLGFERGVAGPSFGNMVLSDGPRSVKTHEFARLDLRARNDGEQSVQLFGFSLVDADGRRYGEESVELFTPNAFMETLGTGESLRGFIGFVIPKRAKIVSVHYASPTSPSGETLTWDLPAVASV